MRPYLLSCCDITDAFIILYRLLIKVCLLFTINHSILNSKFIISHLKPHFMMDFSCLYQYVNERNRNVKF